LAGTLEPGSGQEKVELPEHCRVACAVCTLPWGSIETERGGAISVVHRWNAGKRIGPRRTAKQHEAWMKARGELIRAHCRGRERFGRTVIYRIQSE